MLSDPVWGPRLRELKHEKVKEKMTQALASNLSSPLVATSAKEGHRTRVDRAVIPVLMCEIAAGVRDDFRKALLEAAPGATVPTKPAKEEDAEGERQKVTIELKVGPIKRANRIGVKIEEYAKEKDAAEFPFSKFVTDVLRAS